MNTSPGAPSVQQVLAALPQGLALSTRQIAEATDLVASNVSAQLRRLKRAGLAESRYEPSAEGYVYALNEDGRRQARQLPREARKSPELQRRLQDAIAQAKAVAEEAERRRQERETQRAAAAAAVEEARIERIITQVRKREYLAISTASAAFADNFTRVLEVLLSSPEGITADLQRVSDETGLSFQDVCLMLDDLNRHGWATEVSERAWALTNNGRAWAETVLAESLPTPNDRLVGFKWMANLVKAITDMRTIGWEPLSRFPGATRPWPCLCMKCGAEAKPVLARVRYQGKECQTCRANKAVEDMRAVGWIPVVSYPGFDVPWLSRCSVCGAVAEPRLNNVRAYGRVCRTCKKR